MLFFRKFSSNSTHNLSGINLPELKIVSLLSYMHITPSMVFAIISKLDSPKVCGLDGIVVIVLKKGAHELVAARFPYCWKFSFVFPLRTLLNRLIR